MKYTIIGMLLLITACNGIQVTNELSGTYTTSYNNEFGQGNDTLSVTKASDGEGMYRISKHLGVIKKLDGKTFPKELITETWMLEFNRIKQTLFELKSGKMLIWNGANETIRSGNTLYKKIAE